MPKKNKSKTAQKMLGGKNAIQKESKDGKTMTKADNSRNISLVKDENHHDVGIQIGDMKITLDTSLPEAKSNSYKADLESLSTRVDEHILNITTLQQKLTDLQMKQSILLDGCVNFLQELQGFRATNAEEEKILFETFIEIKTKIKFVFNHLLPKQVEILEREMKTHQINNFDH